MTTTEYTLMACFEEAHGALVAAAKEAHLAKHPQAEAISKLIDALEDIDLEVCGKVSLKKTSDQTLKLGNNLADECDRILGLGLHQNTLPRFKAALEAWRKNN